MKSLALLAAVVSLTACSALDRMGPGVPDAPAKTMVCANTLEPATFRMVLLSGDTLPRVNNHYVMPLSSRDSVPTRLTDGRAAWITFVYDDDHCVTAFDSVYNHNTGKVGYIP